MSNPSQNGSNALQKSRTGLFILGGSTYYTLLLIDSLRSNGVLEGLRRITLFGRNHQRLSLLAEMCQQLVDEYVRDVRVDISTDIHDCLHEDYGLLFNQIRFGGMSSRDQDEKIALQHGLAADETIGIVGVSNAIRAIHGMTPYLDVIKNKAQPYTLVNFTNPCSILTQYMVSHYQLPVVGICDYPQMMKSKIATALQCKPDALDMAYFGLNHFGVVHSVKVDGKEYLPELLQSEFDQALPFKPQCNEYFNTLLNVSWRYVFEQQQVVQEQQSKINRAAQLLEFESTMDALLRDGIRDPNAYFEVLGQRNCDWFNLVVSPLFSNLLGLEQHTVIANAPAVTGDNALRNPLGLNAASCIMEGVCSPGGLQLEAQALPEALLQSQEYALIRQMKQSELQLLQAIVSGDANGIVAACLVNPMIRELGKVQAYFQEVCLQDKLIQRVFQNTQSLSPTQLFLPGDTV
ncbi:hypothetical protein KIH87_05100 [Paraneptunicella aestuarii]|uniref:family 4 glycosyl hydrolase n=1 Tax=Paraneptunicella aestuarii TaxID=2831148 RepID=UPI001E436F8F|nr:hypothetical protein [Paraneptunicella aestuarii]UAA39739.1 hypothetical protein KIH87_05100 [Paraneptunicella aestuarii]